MALDAEKAEIEDIELDEIETEEEETEEAEEVLGDEVEQEADDDSSDDDDDGDDDEVVVSIGDEEVDPEEAEAERAPEWVRDLRKQYRDEKKARKELEAKLAEREAASKPAELEKKPTLEGHDFDTAKYEESLAAWYEKKRERDAAEEAQRAQEAEAEKAWQEKLQGYQQAKTSLKVRDYDDAEEVVQDTLSATQQGMILQGAENAALLVYALGKNPKRAKELGAISDPVKFAFAVARLETQLKVGKKKAASKPERVVTGTGRSSGAVDSTLERLRAEAEKTGDFTKVREYRKKLRKA